MYRIERREVSALVNVVLPRLVGGRDRATQYLDEHRTDLKEADVVVNCRNLRSGSASFADQLVLETLVEAQSAALILVGAPPLFVEHITESATRHGVADRVRTVKELAEVG